MALHTVLLLKLQVAVIGGVCLSSSKSSSLAV